MARREIACAPLEQMQAAFEPGQHGPRRQHFHAGSCEFDRERQTVQPPANLGHRRGILRREAEAKVGGHGSLDEQRDRLGGQHVH